MNKPYKPKPLFTLSGNRLGANAQRFFAKQPAFCADHGMTMPASRPLPAILEVQQEINAKVQAALANP